MPEDKKDEQGMLEKGVGHFQQNFPVHMSNDLIKVVSGLISPNASHAAAVVDAISRACSYMSNCYNQSNDEGTGSNNIQEEGKPQHTAREEEVDFRRPHVVDNFVRRKDVLRKIKKTFNFKKKGSTLQGLFSKLSIEESRRACISGIGGVGKTQVVAKYLKDCEKKERYKSVYWINAEERSCLHKSFLELAKRLEIKEKESGLIDKVYEKMNELSRAAERRTIVVLDNADDSDLVKDYLPNPDYKFINILITSRWRAWENMEMCVIPLNPFTPEESKKFIKNEVEKNNVNKEIEKLAKKLGHLPLALKQAVSYINQEKITIKEYLKRYEEKADELLDFGFLGYNDQYKKTVFTTWLVTLDKIESKKNGKNAIDILNVMAYLAPDDIEKSMLSKLDGGNSAIELLENYSMIDQRKKEGLLDIHRLVQEVVRINLKANKKEEEVLCKAVQAINEGSISESYLESFMCVCKHAMEYPDLNDQLKEAFTLLKKKLTTKKEDEKYLRTAKEFLLAAVKFDNQELVKFALDNIKLNLTEKKWEKWQKGYPINNIILSCKNKEMMKYLKDLKLNVKPDYDCNATYVIRHDNCVAALEFLIDNGMLNEKEQQEWLEQAILEAIEDVVRLLLEKQPNLALKKITKIYLRSGMLFGCCNVKSGFSNILEFAEQCCEKMEGGDEIISLVENAQELVQGYHDNDLLDLEDDLPGTRETSISSDFEALSLDDQSMEENDELPDLKSFEVIDDEEESPTSDYCGPSTESNDAPSSTLHRPLVKRSDQIYSRRC